MEHRSHINDSNSQLHSNDAEQTVSLSMDGVLVVNRDLHIISFSEAAERITGHSQAEVVGKNLYAVFGESVSDPAFPIQDTLGNGTIYSNIDALVSSADGIELSLSVSFAPLKDVHGDIAGVVISFRDKVEMERLTYELKARNYELLAEKGKLEDILNSITDGVFTIDADWHITSFNRAAEEITGFMKGEALGKKCGMLLRGSACDGSCPMRQTIESGRPTYNVEVEIQRKDGRKVPINVNTALLFDDDGAVIGAVETFRDVSKIRQLEEELEDRYRFDTILGKSKPMQELYDLLENVVDSDATVLIQGESGTGKELVARALHYNGVRKEKPFVAVNCSALAENLLESELFGHEKGAFTGAVRMKPGRFEIADGGTLFLDEIGDMSSALQVKLLRVLDEQTFQRVGGTKNIRVDVRIIAATNKNLIEEVQNKDFRKDLYYRLNVVSIWLPPLREHIDDIPLLADHFIHRCNRKMKKSIREISSDVIQHLMDYPWPGNVRELENAIEQAVVLCRGDEIESRHLPRTILTGTFTQEREETFLNEKSLDEGEKQILIRVLNAVNGSRVRAAKRLGLSKATLWRKMKKHGLV